MPIIQRMGALHFAHQDKAAFKETKRLLSDLRGGRISYEEAFKRNSAFMTFHDNGQEDILRRRYGGIFLRKLILRYGYDPNEWSFISTFDRYEKLTQHSLHNDHKGRCFGAYISCALLARDLIAYGADEEDMLIHQYALNGCGSNFSNKEFYRRIDNNMDVIIKTNTIGIIVQFMGENCRQEF